MVGVKVEGGIATTVCVEAALAVCTINVPIALGSSGGMGVGVIKDGTHPMISDRVVRQINSFIFGDAIFPLDGGIRSFTLQSLSRGPQPCFPNGL